MTLTPLQLEITKLIGKKELSFGCILIRHWKEGDEIYMYLGYKLEGVFTERFECLKNGKNIDIPDDKNTEIIGHPATLTDFHRWMNEKFDWQQKGSCIWFSDFHDSEVEMKYIEYNSSKSLLEQDESTLEQIKTLITNNS